MVYFREVQKFRQPWLLAILLLVLVHVAYVARQMWRVQQNLNKEFVPQWALALIFATPGAMIFWVLFIRLETEVGEDELRLHFVGLWFPRRIPLAEIKACEARRYSAIWEYGGWGIRWGPRGRAYNVSGNQGVQLELADGGRLLVGSQQAGELARVINERRALYIRPVPH